MGDTRISAIPGLMQEAILPGGGALAQGIYAESETKKYRLGTRLIVGERVFHYASAGDTLIAGQLCETAAFGGSSATLQTDLVVATNSAAGADYGYATLATDAAALNLYEDGWYSIYDGAAAHGLGQCFQIKSNPVIGAGASGKFTFYDAIPVKITAGTSKVALLANIYKAVKLRSATPVGAPAGIPLIAITSGYYFWLQTWGPAVCLANGALTYEMAALAGTTTEGATDIQVAGASSVVNAEIGWALMTGVSTKYGMIFLRIAP